MVFACFGGAKPKSTGRTGVALRDTREFFTLLKHAERDLRALEGTAEVVLDGSKAVLEGHLPPIREGETARAAESIGGPGFSSDHLVQVKAELSKRLNEEVFAPLSIWSSNYNAAVAKQKVVDKAQVEMEKLTGQVNSLKAKIDGVRSKMPDDPSLPAYAKAEAQLEKLGSQLGAKEGSLASATGHYQHQEAEQFTSLCQLNRDASYLRGFIKAGLTQVGHYLVAAGEHIPAYSSTPEAEVHLAAAAPVAAPAPVPVTAAESVLEAAPEPVTAAGPGPAMMPLPLAAARPAPAVAMEPVATAASEAAVPAVDAVEVAAPPARAPAPTPAPLQPVPDPMQPAPGPATPTLISPMPQPMACSPAAPLEKETSALPEAGSTEVPLPKPASVGAPEPEPLPSRPASLIVPGAAPCVAAAAEARSRPAPVGVPMEVPAAVPEPLSRPVSAMPLESSMESPLQRPMSMGVPEAREGMPSVKPVAVAIPEAGLRSSGGASEAEGVAAKGGVESGKGSPTAAVPLPNTP